MEYIKPLNTNKLERPRTPPPSRPYVRLSEKIYANAHRDTDYSNTHRTILDRFRTGQLFVQWGALEAFLDCAA